MRGTILRVAGKSNSMSSPSISEKVNADVRGWLVLIGLGVLLGAMIVWVLWSAADVRAWKSGLTRSSARWPSSRTNGGPEDDLVARPRHPSLTSPSV